MTARNWIRRLEDCSRLRLYASLFLIAFAVRVACMLATHSYRHPEHSEVVHIAMALAAKGAFADAYSDHSGPTAHAAPLYPLLLSGVFRLVGVGARGDLAQEIFSSLLSSAQYALLPWVAEVSGMSFFVGVL